MCRRWRRGPRRSRRWTTGTRSACSAPRRCPRGRRRRSERRGAPLSSRTSRRACGGELVVQGALLAEQHVAPTLDELGGVAVVGVEVGAVVVLELVPQLALHDRGL